MTLFAFNLSCNSSLITLYNHNSLLNTIIKVITTSKMYCIVWLLYGLVNFTRAQRPTTQGLLKNKTELFIHTGLVNFTNRTFIHTGLVNFITLSSNMVKVLPRPFQSTTGMSLKITLF